jgi:hypothetical protein
MDNAMSCFTCGGSLAPARLAAAEKTWVRQCRRCSTVGELIEQLIRKKLRDSNSSRLVVVHPVSGSVSARI